MEEFTSSTNSTLRNIVRQQPLKNKEYISSRYSTSVLQASVCLAKGPIHKVLTYIVKEKDTGMSDGIGNFSVNDEKNQ